MSEPLRIAVVHSYYSSRVPSGENVVVDLQVEALRRAGHEVEVFAQHQDEVEQDRLYPLRAAVRVATNRGHAPTEELDAFGPDVVHVHNLFPNFGRSWVEGHAERLVATLHNYRPIYPAATLFRDGHPCTLCPDSHTATHAVRHRCYHDSRLATIPMALGTRFAEDPLLRHARRILVLNDDMGARYTAVGVPAERLVTLPNFVPTSATAGAHDGDFWLYVGRLTPEKGVLPLVRDWPSDRRLVVVGSGELESDVRRVAGPGVELTGALTNDEVRTLMGRATGLVFPSLWPEGLPTVYLEALAAGTPVVASRESVVGSLVASEGTGLVMTGDLTADLAEAAARFPGLVDHCRRTYASRYTEDAWVAAVDQVYRDVSR